MSGRLDQFDDFYTEEEKRAYQERRRKARKARKRRERRRRRRRNLIITACIFAGVLVVIFIMLVQAGVFPGSRGRHPDGADTVNAAQAGTADGGLSAGADGSNGAGAGSADLSGTGGTENSSDGSGEAGDGNSGVGSTDTASSGDIQLAEENGIFTRTARTIDLGTSLTDISIYDAQRHISHESAHEGSTEAGSGESSLTGSGNSGTSESGSSESSSSGGSDGSSLSGDSGTGETPDSSSEGDSSNAGSSEDPALAPDYVDSQYVILVNADTGEIVAERDGEATIVPASMTKVMTLLVAVEAMDNPEQHMDDTFEITQDITDAVYKSGSSMVGYGIGDQARVEDLLYGTILPSGADAAMALAEYTAGSQEEFARMMNQKAEELGISKTTHFTNCIGLYDEDHYSTPYDMAVIMKAACENDLCQKVLSTHKWTTAATNDHPEGIEISNWFLRKIEDHMDSGTVECAKTGFVNESGNCAVSTFTSGTGVHYIACTALTYNSWRCIFDHANLYTNYAP